MVTWVTPNDNSHSFSSVKEGIVEEKVCVSRFIPSPSTVATISTFGHPSRSIVLLTAQTQHSVSPYTRQLRVVATKVIKIRHMGKYYNRFSFPLSSRRRHVRFIMSLLVFTIIY